MVVWDFPYSIDVIAVIAVRVETICRLFKTVVCICLRIKCLCKNFDLSAFDMFHILRRFIPKKEQLRRIRDLILNCQLKFIGIQYSVLRKGPMIAKNLPENSPISQ